MALQIGKMILIEENMTLVLLKMSSLGKYDPRKVVGDRNETVWKTAKAELSFVRSKARCTPSPGREVGGVHATPQSPFRAGGRAKNLQADV